MKTIQSYASTFLIITSVAIILAITVYGWVQLVTRWSGVAVAAPASQCTVPAGNVSAGQFGGGSGIFSFPESVGIGTTNPQVRLHVAETGTNVKAIEAGAGGRGVFMVPSLGSGGYNPLSQTGDLGLFFTGGTSESGNLVIGNWSASPTGMRITAAGRVGIGVTNPDAQLHLADIFTAGGRNLQIGDDTFFTDVDTENTLGLYGTQSNGAQGHLRLGSGGQTISGVGGNVGIGTRSPQARLDVAGNIIAADPTAANHVATRGWVETRIGQGGTAGGGPMTWDCIQVRTYGWGRVQIQCPTGRRMVTGGCFVHSNILWETWPLSNGWSCHGACNIWGTCAQTDVTAVCCR